MTRRQILAVLVAAAGWSALALQLWLSLAGMTANGFSPGGALWRILGYFTILTNILVAIVATRAAIRPDARGGVNDPRFELAVAAAILIVGIVYGVLLAHLVNLAGAHLLADMLLHRVQPVLFLLLWWMRRTGRLAWRDALWAPALPAAYAVYALARGRAEGWYAYWFFDADKLGAAELARNSVAMLAVTLLVGAALVWADGRKAAADPAPG
ncbi:hypothetical protein D1610_09675 [Sphingomonas gilva]|uniref:Pr6Pr family membrane protein n=1 Tax=Sphingomonas gilva TaxID=2305907 RepID=A0A396RMT9_9SPHN|nr:Pr6Pr family membrane protein [Sphingomonas gilva]RHW17698.1 hypothetical protein D1610_09675 [Sphingomonas gilva]